MNKTLTIVTVLVLAAIAVFVYLMLMRSNGLDYKVWPITINQISKTEQLKVASFHKEILVSEHRISKGLFSNTEDKLYIIYPATLNLGFDLSKCNEQTFRRIGEDTVFVTLPPVEVLNKNGYTIDEAGKHTAIEKGIWSNETIGLLKKRAEAIMLRSCEYDSCYRKAEELGKIMVKALVKKLGYATVVVEVQPRKSYGLALMGERYACTTPYKFYQEQGKRFLLFKGRGERRMYFPGATFSYPQLFALGDYFNRYLKDCDVEVKKVSNTLLVSLRHRTTSGSKAAVDILKNANPEEVARWKKDIAGQIFNNSLNVKVEHVDMNNNVLYTYP
ncbi:MAG: DUF4230 domain-containing protein [Prevotella sp.]|nr:DUF4230 domain-containing protein [Prevotella sp.]